MREMPLNDRDGCPRRTDGADGLRTKDPMLDTEGVRVRTGGQLDPSNPKGRPPIYTSEAVPHRKRRQAVGPAVPGLSGHVVTSGSSSEPGPRLV